MIDIHTHIIPEFDDGAKSWDESVEMLRQAAEDGITDIVATPHILNDNDFAREQELLDKFSKLQKLEKNEKFGLTLYLGCELYAYPEMKFDKTFATLNDNGKYFLIEFPMNTVPVFIPDRFFTLALEGLIPIIAHPERYLNFINNPQLAFDFIQRGALMQINAGSLRGVFGQTAKKMSELMMDANLVHFIASDAHSSNNRHPRLRETYNLVANRWGVESAEIVFRENPRKVLTGEPITIQEPIPLENLEGQKRKFRSFFSKVLPNKRSS